MTETTLRPAHSLKVWPPYFEHLLDGRKRFDVRFNDRHFKVGDGILFHEYVPADQGKSRTDYFTGRKLLMRIRYIFKPRPDIDADRGLVPGYVVLDLERIPNAEGGHASGNDPAPSAGPAAGPAGE
jgi:hypothetical protein